MLTQFRHRYPQGSLISELIKIDCGKYIVRVSVGVDGITLATGLAAAETIEAAEDLARNRALALVVDENVSTVQSSHSPKNTTITPEGLPEVRSKPVSTEKINNGFQKTESQTNRDLTTSKSDNAPLDLPKSLQTKTTTSSLEVNDDKPELASPVSEETIPSSTEYKELESFPSSIEEANSVDANTIETEEMNFNDIIDRTDREIQRLGWTKEQGKEYLLKTYGKRSRLRLTDGELLEFLHHLESLPTP